MPFEFEPLALDGLVLVRPSVFLDARGVFAETYKRSDFLANGIQEDFVQDNASRSRRGTLRGLHFQRPPFAQAKLVQVTRGRIFDVAVDLREGSPTFLRWHAVELSDEDRSLLYLPAGFGHGFCVLSEEADVTYKASAEYAPESEGGIIWNDPDIAVDWPLDDPIVSARDARLPRWRDAAAGFVYQPGPAAVPR
jgi:dTDP-4-dehydrorhamnose 3,5-epimerase